MNVQTKEIIQPMELALDPSVENDTFDQVESNIGQLAVEASTSNVELQDILSQSTFEIPEHFAEVAESPVAAVGVLKLNSTNGESHIDGLVFDGSEHSIERLIYHFASKKDQKLQQLLKDAVDYIAQHPESDGSKIVRGINKGKGTPMFSGNRIKLWRFRPDEAQGFKSHPSLRTVRLLYSVVEGPDHEKLLGIVNIFSRADFAKLYH